MAATTDSGVTAVKDKQASQADSATTPCMPCSFGLLPHPRSEPRAQLNDPLRVTVTVRWLPLVTAAYGTRVARPARTTWLGAAAMGSSFSAGGGPSRATRASLASAPQEGSSCAKAIATTDPGHPDPSVIARNVRNDRVDL